MIQEELDFRTRTQSEMVLSALRAGEHLTALDALKRFGCFRLAARVYDLKRGTYDGQRWEIRMEHVGLPGGKRCSAYWLEPEDRERRATGAA